MPCGYHRGVVLVFICGVTKVHNFHIWVLQCSLISFLRTKKRNATHTSSGTSGTNKRLGLLWVIFLDKYLGHLPF